MRLNYCLSVVRRFKSDRKAATSKAANLGRLWNVIFDLFDDFEDPARQVNLDWLPAHASVAQIGRARKGDGAKMTQRGRDGNNEADRIR